MLAQKHEFGYEILSNVLMEEQLKTAEYVQEHHAVKLPGPREEVTKERSKLQYQKLQQ